MSTTRLAGFATRALGLIIDLVILDIATLATGGAIAWAARVLGFEVSPSTGVVAALTAAGWLTLISAYLSVFWSLTGQTPGMRFMGIRVSDRRGATPGLTRSLRRLVGFYLAAIPLGAGFLLVLVDDRRRGLHDRLAGTLVIHDHQASSRRGSRARATASDREQAPSLRS
jgi:uncharacterized RDD family membrane protein YckC